MDIKYLPLDLGEEFLDITVGIQAETSAVERVAEPFRERLHVVQNTDSCSTVGCEVVFRQSESQQEVELLLLDREEQLPEYRMVISVAASPFSALDSVAHTILAPSFAPGGVGIDWADVCMILRSGQRAVLIMTESDEAVAETLRLAESVLATDDRARVSGVMPVVFAPQGKRWAKAVQQLRSVAETLAPDAWRLVAAPVILADTPVCSVLAVLSE